MSGAGILLPLLSPPYVCNLSRHASVPLPQEHWEEHAPAAVPPWFLPSNVNSLQGTL